MKKNTSKSKIDLLTYLPDNIIETILVCLPIRDMVQTSILSREWRHKWMSCPDIVFHLDETCLEYEPFVYQILKLHRGPLLKFALDVYVRLNIDHFIHLLPNETLQDLTLQVYCGETHKLTSHLFLFQNLRNLKIGNYVFDLVPGFKGFNKLVKLELEEVTLVSEDFMKFMSSCGSIEKLSLIACEGFHCLEIVGPRLKSFMFTGVFGSVKFGNCPVLADVTFSFRLWDSERERVNRLSFDFVKSLSCLPALENLECDAYGLHGLVKHGAPGKLPISLKMLKNLIFKEICFEVIDSCPICFIRSCPNLQRLGIIRVSILDTDCAADLLRSGRGSGSLPHLKIFKMRIVSGNKTEMEFLKYILGSATALEEMAIIPSWWRITDREESILNELKQYPRASPSAEIFISL